VCGGMETNMKKIAAVIILVSVLTGCVPQGDNTEYSIEDIMTDLSMIITPNEVLNTVSNSPYTDVEKGYEELKNEFFNNLEFAKQEASKEDSGGDVIAYLAQSRRVFEKMLDYWESLEDFNETIIFTYSERHDLNLSIDIKPVFTEGNSNYRVLSLAADNLAMTRMYVQIFNDEFLESQYVYVYQVDADEIGEIVYCDFKEGLDKTHLVIIHKKQLLGSYSYCLATYELGWKELFNYNALRKELPGKSWIVKEELIFDESISLEVVVARISHVNMHGYPWYSSENDSQIIFVNNELTIILGSYNKEELTLLLENGYWEFPNI